MVPKEPDFLVLYQIDLFLNHKDQVLFNHEYIVPIPKVFDVKQDSFCRSHPVIHGKNTFVLDSRWHHHARIK